MQIEPFKLERFYTIHEFSAKYLMCSSDCEAMSIGELLALEENADEKFKNLWLGYTETKGGFALRQEISNLYNDNSPDNILVCAAAQEPIFLFCHAILKPEDEIIIQFPCYQSIESIPLSLGCKVKKWIVRYVNNKPEFNLDELTTLVTDKTKVIFLNSPHNPTGHHFSYDELKKIIDLARKHNCIIFSDEVYRELEHSPQFALPAMSDIYENGVSLGVMSKAYGLPGLRIGWIATPVKYILEQMAILKEYTTICSSAPSEFLSGLALRNRSQILDRNLNIIRPNLALLDLFFEKYDHLFSWHKPNAGPISLVRLNFESNDLNFANQVIKEKSVLILPGYVFDFHGFFRVGFGRKNLPEALSKFEEYICEKLIK